MTTREFYTWLAYLNIEPPDQAEENRNAALQATIMNMSGRSLHKGKFVTPAQLQGEEPLETVQTPEQQQAFLKSLGRGS